MLDLLGRHGRLGLKVEAAGDLETGAHHTVEDVGIALGQALDEALGDRAGIRRYGYVAVPMDEALGMCAIDISGRPLCLFEADLPPVSIAGFDTELAEEFFRAVANNARITLHVGTRYGSNAHHMIEACFKAFARALREAVSIDPDETGVPSTKGTLTTASDPDREAEEPTRFCVLDYGMGNLRSVEKALEHVGINAEVTDDHERARAADGVILPGVGAFPKAMERVRERGLDELIAERVSNPRCPVLGICLGLQLIFESSTELGGAQGLGLVDGPVSGLRADGLKVPHIGWSPVTWAKQSRLTGASPRRSRSTSCTRSRRVRTTPDDMLGTAAYGERILLRGRARQRLRRPVPPGEVERRRDCACCAISPRSVLLCLLNRRRPLPPFGPGLASGPTSSDPLSRDRHPGGPGGPAPAGRLRPRDGVRRRPGRRRAALGGGRARRGFTSSTSTAPAPGRRRTSTTCGRIARAVDPPLQLGGGLRDAEAVDAALDAGAERVVIGTAALRDPEFLDAMLDRHGQRVVVGVDARSGMAATEGWVETSDEPAPAFIRSLAERGASRIVFTPIEVDGTMEGPRLSELRAIAADLDAELILLGRRGEPRPPAGARGPRAAGARWRDRRQGALRGAIRRRGGGRGAARAALI